MNVHLYRSGKVDVININNVKQEDFEYFTNNNIKVTLEELHGEIIVYACPYTDETEESEIIVFANGRNCIDVMTELANKSKQAFKG